MKYLDKVLQIRTKKSVFISQIIMRRWKHPVDIGPFKRWQSRKLTCVFYKWLESSTAWPLSYFQLECHQAQNFYLTSLAYMGHWHLRKDRWNPKYKKAIKSCSYLSYKQHELGGAHTECFCFRSLTYSFLFPSLLLFLV